MVSEVLPALTDIVLISVFGHIDDEELSSTWETAYFDDDEVRSSNTTLCLPVSDSLKVAQLLNSKAIVLRLTQGSQEAGFLASFCPLSKFPTVVLIKCVEQSVPLRPIDIN